MVPKPKKNKFKKFDQNTLQEIETKLKESSVNTEKEKKSQRRQGNPRDKNTSIQTENINNDKNLFEEYPALKKDFKDIAQNIQEVPSTSSDPLESNNSKCLPDDNEKSEKLHGEYVNAFLVYIVSNTIFKFD